jgi:hypothetical protein
LNGTLIPRANANKWVWPHTIPGITSGYAVDDGIIAILNSAMEPTATICLRHPNPLEYTVEMKFLHVVKACALMVPLERFSVVVVDPTSIKPRAAQNHATKLPAIDCRHKPITPGHDGLERLGSRGRNCCRRPCPMADGPYFKAHQLGEAADILSIKSSP